MSVLDYRTADLEPTATYSARRYTWVPSDAGPQLGTLTITCDYARRNKVDTDSYHVLPAATAGDIRAASVELANLETGEVYAVALGPEPRCGCKANQCKLACKHLAALEDLEREDPGTLTPAPRPVEAQALAPPTERFARSSIVVPF